MPVNVHTFPPPPRPSGSKVNGHAITTEHDEANEELSTNRPISGHIRGPSLGVSEDMDCEDSDEEDEGRVFVHGELAHT
jgi:hypothetical protein